MNEVDESSSLVAADSELGKLTAYDQTYNPKRLYPIARMGKRQEIGIEPGTIPFYGFDCWNHYEVSWLNMRGKPEVAIAEIIYDCHSPMIVESKSLKLYFNSLNQTRLPSVQAVTDLVKQDLQHILGAEVQVRIQRLQDLSAMPIMPSFTGENIDDLDIACEHYQVNSAYLKTTNEIVSETLCSDLLKSNCLVTNQPDWGSVQISYTGKKIDREGLLQYLVSFRNHNEFHEQCIERIYMDIMTLCQPVKLMVYGRYTRRGGLDINPLRSSTPINADALNFRLVRQ